METNLQQRLIGAVLLVTLGVIFIPMILDGSGFKDRQQRHIEMPNAPAYPPMDEIYLKPVEPTHVIQQRESERPKKAQPSKLVENVVPEKSPDILKAPLMAFALQVATLTSDEKATALRDQLRKDGYTAYIETETTSAGKTQYKVRIGPELDRKRLEAMDREIEKTHRLDGFIVNHP